MVDNFFSRIRDKKTQNYIKHKRHIWSFSDLQRAISRGGRQYTKGTILTTIENVRIQTLI